MAEYGTTNGKSAAELEREVELQRDRVADTIDQIQTRLSPGQLLDELMDYTKGGAGDFAANLGRSVKDNPLPVALLGASLLWLMSGKNPIGGHSGHSHAPAHPYGGGTAPVGYRPGDSDAVRHQAYHDDHGHDGHGLADGLKHAAAGAAEKVSHAADSAGEKLSGAAAGANARLHDARDALHSGVDHARDGLSHAGSGISQRAHDLQGSAMNLFRDQPLVAGALAFAAGAAVGAAIPVSSKEREVFGDTAADAVSAVREAAAPYVEKGKDVVSKVVEEGKEVAHDTVETGKAALKDAKTTLSEGLEHVKDDVAGSIDTKSGASTKPSSTPKASPGNWQNT